MQLGMAALRATSADRRTLAVAAGDLAAIVGVLVVGLLRHGIDPLSAVGHAALVVGPFVVGWAVAAPLVGSYAGETLASHRLTVATGVAAWLPAVAVGVGARATTAFPGSTPAVFVAVVTGFGALAVGGWRTLLAAASLAGTDRGG